MANIFVICALLCTFAFAHTIGAVSEYTLAYEDGANVTHYTHQPMLPENTVIQHCNKGVWIYYTGPNYTMGPAPGLVGILSFDRYCGEFPMVVDTILSARPAGLTSDNSVPSVTFYEKKQLEGNDVLVVDGLPKLEFPIEGSIFIHSSVEFFTEENYGGESMCVSRSYCDNNDVCVFWDFSDLGLPWTAAEVKSVKVGCSA